MPAAFLRDTGHLVPVYQHRQQKQMDDAARATISLVSKAFQDSSGPVALKYPESGWWYEWEGKDIAKALLELNPKDIQYEEILHPIDGSFVPAWTTAEGLLWLLPGIIRVVFDVDPQNGDDLLQDLFFELNKRVLEGDISLTNPQIEALLEVHEVFYCTEDFDWNPDAHFHPLVETMKERLIASSCD